VLAALVVSLREELIETRAELQRALARVAELEARLAANSVNSSKPPSSDGLAKPAPKPRSLRKKTDRKPGGQRGHDGTTLRQVAKPKHEVVHEPGPCTGCGCSLAGRSACSCPQCTGNARRQAGTADVPGLLFNDILAGFGSAARLTTHIGYGDATSSQSGTTGGAAGDATGAGVDPGSLTSQHEAERAPPDIRRAV
jgi:hypothetical protein